MIRRNRSGGDRIGFDPRLIPAHHNGEDAICPHVDLIKPLIGRATAAVDDRERNITGCRGRLAEHISLIVDLLLAERQVGDTLPRDRKPRPRGYPRLVADQVVALRQGEHACPARLGLAAFKPQMTAVEDQRSGGEVVAEGHATLGDIEVHVVMQYLVFAAQSGRSRIRGVHAQDAAVERHAVRSAEVRTIRVDIRFVVRVRDSDLGIRALQPDKPVKQIEGAAESGKQQILQRDSGRRHPDEAFGGRRVREERCVALPFRDNATQPIAGLIPLPADPVRPTAVRGNSMQDHTTYRVARHPEHISCRHTRLLNMCHIPYPASRPKQL